MLQLRQARIEAAGQRKLADKIERRSLPVPAPTVAQQIAEARASLGMALKPGGGGPVHTPFGSSPNPAYDGYKSF